MFVRLAIALAASASMLPLAAEAQAQTQDNAHEEIIVTAQKREERLRDIPQSVTAVTEETLERLQANSFEDYVGRIPGMVATGSQPGNSRLVLRGINNGGIGSAVGTYIDETPFGSSSGLVNAAELALDLDPFDVERVEVLRGPQGTLYGATALAGLIRFVTRDPSTDAVEFRARTTAETTEDGEQSYTIRGAANIPMGDQAALRISAFRRDAGGYIDGVRDDDDSGDISPGDTVIEDYNAVETTGARATFLLNATENIDIRLSAMIQDIRSDNFNNVQYNVVGGSIAGPTYGDLTRFGADFDNVSDTAYRVFNGTVNWDLGFATLTSSTSYGELDQFRFLGDDHEIGIRQNNDVLQDKWTQEVRLTSPSRPEGLEWQVGAFYTDEGGVIHQQQDFQVLVANLGFDSILAGLLSITEAEVLAASNIELFLNSTYEEFALFGNATYHFSPQFDLGVGVRQSRNEQSIDQIVNHTIVSPFLAGLNSASSESDEDVTTWSISPRWRPNENTTVYGRVATGYRAGGPNISVVGSTALPPTYDADTTINYEIGVKTDLIDNLLSLDAAVFYIDWDDVQLLVADSVGGQDVSGNANGGTAVSQGVEWSAQLTPSAGLTILWTGAYTDASLTSDAPAGTALIMADGDRLPYSPEWSTSLDVDYEWTVFGDAEAYVGGGARYVSDQMSGFGAVAPQVEIPSYTVFDLRSGVTFERFGVELFARNVSNERGPAQIGPTTTFDDASPLRPRTIGVSLTANF